MNTTNRTGALPPRAQEVHDFWFFPGCIEQLVAVLKQGKRLWWHSKDLDVDRRITERFAGDLPRASRGEYDGWLETARGTLAFLILVDQFPRHIYRDNARAFDLDPLALATCRKGMARGFHMELEPVQRYFFCLPLMHDPKLETQRESCAFYEELHRTAPEHLKLGLGLVRDAARRHLEIVERFGRFPHRNAALRLESTPEEVAFLTEPHSSF
jgi:uncharacterized protein (DUF924 family)